MLSGRDAHPSSRLVSPAHTWMLLPVVVLQLPSITTHDPPSPSNTPTHPHTHPTHCHPTHAKVNNAVFSSYLQHARHEALAALGHDVDASARSGAPLALSELTLRFKAPLRSRDAFRVSVWVQKVGGARAVLGQQIELLPRPVVQAGHPLPGAAQAGGAQGDGSSQEGASLGGSASQQAPPAPQVGVHTGSMNKAVWW